MKIFNLSRGCGKTIRMLYASEYHNAPILCATGKSKQHIMDMAKYYSINIPEPITVADIVCDKANGKNVNEVLVDDMDCVFGQLLSHLGLNMIGGTITIDKGVK
jgi:type III secretion system FlhB-like substrate exporter